MHLGFFEWSSPNKDPGLQKCQDIFRRHPERIFQWAENRSVPAEHNMSERGVRRTVIARKVCGGSQSKDALMVREVLQSVIESLRLRCADPVATLTEALDAYAVDPSICIPDLLFPLPTHKAELSRCIFACELGRNQIELGNGGFRRYVESPLQGSCKGLFCGLKHS